MKIPWGRLGYIIDEITDLEDTQGSELLIYPNPFEKKLVIQISKGAAIFSFKINGIDGKVILSDQINNTVTNLDTNELLPGVYLFQAIDSTIGIRIYRIIKH